jgi:integrase
MLPFTHRRPIDEVAQLIGAARNLYHRTILMTLYSTGLRRAELCRLKVADVDSKRMMLRVVQGKGGIDREVPLSKKLLSALREYYRWMRSEAMEANDLRVPSSRKDQSYGNRPIGNRDGVL